MAGVQVRIAEDVVTVASTEADRKELGFTSDLPLGTVVSELARDGAKYRRMVLRDRARAETYAQWAENDELHEDVAQTLQWRLDAR